MSRSRPVLIGASDRQQQFYARLVAEHGSPLLVFDPKQLQHNYRALQAALPGVRLHYAIKAHPHPRIIAALAALGAGFDVASAGEARLLSALRICGRRTLHSHPIKTEQEIKAALRFGATTFVLDNPTELEKLIPYRQRIGVLLRVALGGDSAVVDLSGKFGCAPEEVAAIVRQADARGVQVKGLSFHVGSQCVDGQAHARAIESCGHWMRDLNRQRQTPLSTLDIGGGFPADYALQGIDMDAHCAPIRKALSGLPQDWHLLAEPGRALIASAVTAVARVIGMSRRQGVDWYYLDDGIYGSYSGQLFDHARYPLQVLRCGPLRPAVLAGPTCDGIDVIARDIRLPELRVGDLVLGHRMGAYTAATRTGFNSLPEARLVVQSFQDDTIRS